MSARPVGHLDKQLEQLLARLRAAHGDPVSFEDLRAQGVENPALLCYELEVAGVPLERVHLEGGGAGAPVAVQLEESGLRQNTQPMPAAELPDALGQRVRAGMEWTRLLLADTRDEAADLAARAAGAVRTLAGEGRAVEPPRREPPLREPPNGVARPPRPPAPNGPSRGHGAAARRRLDTRRAGALVALVLACATVLTIVLANMVGSSGGRPSVLAAQVGKHRGKAKAVQTAAAPATTSAAGAPSAAAQQTTSASSQAASATPPPGTATAPTPPSQPPAPAGPAGNAAASPQAAASLQAQGHQLLAEGRYPPAINQLQAAAAASGGSVARCAEPSDDACLTYAYALYDLGRALRLDGQTASALVVLGERLQIDNQRPVVEGEIALARGANAASGDGTQAAAPAPKAPPLRHPGRRRAHEGQR